MDGRGYVGCCQTTDDRVVSNAGLDEVGLRHVLHLRESRNTATIEHLLTAKR